MSSLHIAGVVAVATVWSVAAPPQSLSERLDAEIGRLAAEVAQGPAMELPPTPPGIPPPKVTRAGPEFVNAWQLAHRLLAIPLHDPAADGAAVDPSVSPEPSDKEALNNLLERALIEIPPPQPIDLTRVAPRHHYGPQDLMATARLLNQGKLLLELRWNRPARALRLAVGKGGSGFGDLLKAFRIDPEAFALGWWLHGEFPATLMSSQSGEFTARMAVTWAELYPGEAGNQSRRLTEPVAILPMMLDPQRAVTPATRARIVRFIETTGLTLKPAEFWIDQTPPEGRPLLAKLGESALAAKSQATRLAAHRFLTELGIDHKAPAPMPPIRLRVILDGRPWPGTGPKPSWQPECATLWIDTAAGSHHLQLERTDDGLLRATPDTWLDEDPATRMVLHHDPADLDLPKLQATLSKPLRAGETHTVRLTTAKLTLRPRYPAGRITDSAYPVLFRFGSSTRHTTGGRPLVIPRITAGRWSLEIQHPGLVPATDLTITTTGADQVFRPALATATTWVVPIESTGDLMDGTWPVELAAPFIGFIQGERAPGSLPRLQLNGRFYQSTSPMPYTDSLANEMVGRMCGGAVFFALPPGTYEAAVPELRSAGDSLREPMRLPADSTTVTITAASPEVIVATDRLRICLEPE